MKIDFVSDVVCPWCAIGLQSLQQALSRVPELAVELHFQPFELNPQMGPQGQDIEEHLHEKYGSSPEQLQASREAIRQRGADLGFRFDMASRARIYNTFDAHRLLHWAGLQSAAQQLALKQRLLADYFTEGRNPSDREVLLEAAVAAGLDRAGAAKVLDSDAHAQDIRAAQDFYRSHGINGVPAVIINERHLIQGGQPPEVFEQALRKLMNAPDAA